MKKMRIPVYGKIKKTTLIGMGIYLIFRCFLQIFSYSDASFNELIFYNFFGCNTGTFDIMQLTDVLLFDILPLAVTGSIFIEAISKLNLSYVIRNGSWRKWICKFIKWSVTILGIYVVSAIFITVCCCAIANRNLTFHITINEQTEFEGYRIVGILIGFAIIKIMELIFCNFIIFLFSIKYWQKPVGIFIVIAGYIAGSLPLPVNRYNPFGIAFLSRYIDSWGYKAISPIAVLVEMIGLICLLYFYILREADQLDVF